MAIIIFSVVIWKRHLLRRSGSSDANEQAAPKLPPRPGQVTPAPEPRLIVKVQQWSTAKLTAAKDWYSNLDFAALNAKLPDIRRITAKLPGRSNGVNRQSLGSISPDPFADDKHEEASWSHDDIEMSSQVPAKQEASEKTEMKGRFGFKRRDTGA